MKLLDRLTLPLLLRRLDKRLAEQNLYLKRLADHFAPELNPEPVDQKIRSVDFSEDRQQALTLDYIDRMVRDVGREPTEEEILSYLDNLPAGSAH